MNKSIIDMGRRAGHKQRLARAFPGDIKTTAGQFHAYRFSEQPLLDPHRHRGAGAAAAGLGFPAPRS